MYFGLYFEQFISFIYTYVGDIYFYSFVYPFYNQICVYFHRKLPVINLKNKKKCFAYKEAKKSAFNIRKTFFGTNIPLIFQNCRNQLQCSSDVLEGDPKEGHTLKIVEK